jgi:hypothetical protein
MTISLSNEGMAKLTWRAPPMPDAEERAVLYMLSNLKDAVAAGQIGELLFKVWISGVSRHFDTAACSQI